MILNGVEHTNLIRAIAREIESRYDWIDLRPLLAAYNVKEAKWNSDESFFVCIRRALANADHSSLIKLANDLSVAWAGRPQIDQTPPAIWKDTKYFRLFVSHIAQQKGQAHRLKETLEKFHISAFVAHDDIEPTKPWQAEIERALKTMDAMVTMHNADFKQSYWAQQEVGFALGRGAKIIPVRMDEDPVGFIASIQAIQRRKRTADEVSAEISALLANDPATKERMAEVNAAFRSVDDEIPF